ncbi:MAG: helix-turn-helix domain-containing protein [Pseudomonadota bacterium]
MSLILDRSDFAFVESLIESCGLDTKTLLEDLGLPSALFDRHAEHKLTLPKYASILRRLVEASGDETCKGSARQILIGTTPFLLGGVPKGTKLAEVFKRLAYGYNIAHGGAYNLTKVTANRLVYTIDDATFPYSTDQFRNQSNAFIESILFSLHCLFETLSGRPLNQRVVKITTKRSSDRPLGAFLKYWRAPIEFGATSYGLYYDARIADWPVSALAENAYLNIFDATENDGAKSLAPGKVETWSDCTRHLIDAGVDDQTQVANALGVSLATLRRRLAVENTTFRDLRSTRLKARAIRLLDRGDAPAKVATALGFSDLRSFSRAFKSWTGTTPTAFQIASS